MCIAAKRSLLLRLATQKTRSAYLRDVRNSPSVKGGFVGLGTGLLGSMAGLGGGPFCVPLLTVVTGLTHKQCLGTSLVCALTTLTIGGVTTYVNATSSIALLPIGVLACIAPVCGYTSSKLSKHISSQTLKRGFSVFLVVTSMVIFCRAMGDGHGGSDGYRKHLKDFVETNNGFLAYHVGLATIAGTASGLLGIAGGSVLVPLMSLADVAPWQTITTTSLISMIPTSIASAAAHHSMGNIHLPLVPSLVAGTCIGAFIGPKLMANVEERVRKLVCASVLLTTATVMLLV